MDDLLGTRQAGGPKLEFRLLGPLEVRRGGRIVGLGGPKPRALLTDLLLHLGQAVSIDRLIDDLWGEEAPETAVHAVEVYVSQLRKALAPDGPGGRESSVLVTARPGYLLEAEPEQVDIHRFQRLVDDGRSALADGDPARASLSLREA
jgi:DNA-binding SARP family transcriptional activator